MMGTLLFIVAMVLAVLLIFGAATLATLMFAKPPSRRRPRR
jgi:flagellar basal body-associated protein FliL